MSDTTFLSASRNKTIKLWNITTGECLETFEGHSSSVTSVCQVSATTFLSASYDKTIKMWDISAGICMFSLVCAHFIRDIILVF